MVSKGLSVVLAAIRPVIPVFSTFTVGSPMFPMRYQISEAASSSLPRAVVTRRLKSLSMVSFTL